MQGAKGLWRRFLGFLEGGVDEEEWDNDSDMISYDPDDDEIDPDSGLDLGGMERRDRGRGKSSNNVLDFERSRNPQANGKIMVKISRPKEMQDATLICESLQEGMICIVGMQGVERTTAQRIADYLGGVSYALRGHVERIDNYIFVIVPEGAKVDSDLKEEIKSSGLFKSFGSK